MNLQLGHALYRYETLVLSLTSRHFSIWPEKVVPLVAKDLCVPCLTCPVFVDKLWIWISYVSLGAPT